MTGIMTLYRRLNDFLSAGFMILGVVIVAFAVVALFASAVERHVSGMGYAWMNDLPPFLLPWCVFPLLGVLVRNDRHVTVRVVPEMLKGTARKVVHLTAYGICFVSGVVLCYAGVQATDFFRNLGQTSETGIEFQMWYLFASFPAGFAILANFSLEAFLNELVGYRRAASNDDVGVSE